MSNEVKSQEYHLPKNPPQHKQNQQSKKPQKHHLKIVYEEATKTVAQVVLEIKEYDDRVCHRSNIERCMGEIYDAGGFWLNETTMIPYTKVYSISTYVINEGNGEQPKQPKQNRKFGRGSRYRANKPQQKVEKVENKKPDSPPSPGILNLS